jgi:uncharacterized protein YdiU (UPF0061 family)
VPLIQFRDLPWQSRFVEKLPGDPRKDNFTRQVPDAAYSEVAPTPVREPRLIGWSDDLAQELGIERPAAGSESLRLLAGNLVLPGMRPYSARYGGHQFGNWAGQLGDGRAITLGEAETRAGMREFQLKGAGPTPYSRRADGRAVLRSSLREFACSEAMHWLGVPTTRALSLVATGEPVVRDMFYDGNPEEEPGAIVCRVAPSFLRFGNFEILSSLGEYELLKRLADHLIAEHYPELDPADPDVYGKLTDEISRRTAVMISHWMRVGFVHGVMNTDNMSALGLTIDYGPYGWLEPFDPGWTPNTTDAQGRRYRYGHQPAIAQWNLARFCEAIHPLVATHTDERLAESRLYDSLKLYQDTFQKTYAAMLAQKLGFASERTLENPDAQRTVDALFKLLVATETDMTLFFRGISNWDPTQGGDRFVELIAPAFYAEGALDAPATDGTQGPAALRARWAGWSEAYAAVLRSEGRETGARQASMKLANPKYVLRNYLAQQAIDAATRGDTSVLERLLRVLRRPYDEQSGEEDLAARRPEWARHKPGCSALSCSS